jgi:RNA polymerase sigma-70 factor (ECF subfamily)
VPEQPEAVLVSEARRGDVAAFEALYKKYNTMVFRTAYAILRDRFGAEEVTQECFVRAYRSLQTVDAGASLGPWLHRIAVNLSYNWWKNARRHWVFPLQSALREVGLGHTESPLGALQQSELRDAVMSGLESLGFDQRVVVILFYYGGFSMEEIAYILDCPVGTVKSRLHYGRCSLKRQLQSIGEALPEVAYEF